VDFSSLEAAAKSGAEQGLSTLSSQARETTDDPTGQVGALFGGQGLQTEEHTTDSASKISDILAGRPR
jgi:hypothetical protein